MPAIPELHHAIVSACGDPLLTVIDVSQRHVMTVTDGLMHFHVPYIPHLSWPSAETWKQSGADLIA